MATAGDSMILLSSLDSTGVTLRWHRETRRFVAVVDKFYMSGLVEVANHDAERCAEPLEDDDGDYEHDSAWYNDEYPDDQHEPAFSVGLQTKEF